MKIFRHILFAAAVMLLGAACTDTRTEYLDEYDVMVYFRNGGEQEIALYRTGENGYYSIPICKAGSDQTATISAQILPFDDTRMGLYNAVNYTNYTVIPRSMYEFLSEDESTVLTDDPLSLDFASDESSKVIKLRMNTSEISALMVANPDKTYIFAFQLVSTDKVSDDINLLLLQPKITIPYLSLSSTGMENYTYDKSSPLQATYTNRVKLGIDQNRWDFSCNLSTGSAAWVAEYNTANGTSYKLLPAASYEMPTTVNFDRGETEVKFDITVDRTNMQAFTDYLLPIMIESCSKNEFVPYTSTELDTYVYMLHVMLNGDKIVITDEQLTAFYDGTAKNVKANLVDNDESTIWASPGSYKYGGTPGDPTWGFWFDIALNVPLSQFVMGYCASANAVRCPSRIKLGVSNDGVNYTLVGDYATEDMRSLVGWHDLPLANLDTAYSYIRIGLIETYINGGVQSLVISTVDMTCEVAELRLYGAE